MEYFFSGNLTSTSRREDGIPMIAGIINKYYTKIRFQSFVISRFHDIIKNQPYIESSFHVLYRKIQPYNN